MDPLARIYANLSLCANGDLCDGRNLQSPQPETVPTEYKSLLMQHLSCFLWGGISGLSAVATLVSLSWHEAFADVTEHH